MVRKIAETVCKARAPGARLTRASLRGSWAAQVRDGPDDGSWKANTTATTAKSRARDGSDVLSINVLACLGSSSLSTSRLPAAPLPASSLQVAAEA
jgi:hypothetical protein